MLCYFTLRQKILIGTGFLHLKQLNNLKFALLIILILLFTFYSNTQYNSCEVYILIFKKFLHSFHTFSPQFSGFFFKTETYMCHHIWSQVTKQTPDLPRLDKVMFVFHKNAQYKFMQGQLNNPKDSSCLKKMSKFYSHLIFCEQDKIQKFLTWAEIKTYYFALSLIGNHWSLKQFTITSWQKLQNIFDLGLPFTRKSFLNVFLSENLGSKNWILILEDMYESESCSLY